MATLSPLIHTNYFRLAPTARPVAASTARAQQTRREINMLLNLLLPSLLIVSFVTGFIASYFGMTEFGLHKYSSIAVFVVAFGHLGLHARAFLAQARRFYNGLRNAS